MNILEIIENSNDSKLLNLNCNQNELILEVAHDYFEKNIRLTFPYQNFFNTFSSKSDGICFLSIEDIENQLDVKNGVYIPSIDFSDFMYEVKEGNSCAYGLRKSKFKKFFKVVGSFRVVIPCESLNIIKIEIINN